MKKIVVFTFCFTVALVLSFGANSGMASSAVKTDSEQSELITLEQARKIALAKVPGKIEDEYLEEDDEGEAALYIFSIRQADQKLFEVKVNATDGKVTSVEEVEEEEEEEEDPPATDTNL